MPNKLLAILMALVFLMSACGGSPPVTAESVYISQTTAARAKTNTAQALPTATGTSTSTQTATMTRTPTITNTPIVTGTLPTLTLTSQGDGCPALIDQVDLVVNFEYVPQANVLIMKASRCRVYGADSFQMFGSYIGLVEGTPMWQWNLIPDETGMIRALQMGDNHVTNYGGCWIVNELDGFLYVQCPYESPTDTPTNTRTVTPTRTPTPTNPSTPTFGPTRTLPTTATP